jgi:hypothetical protein
MKVNYPTDKENTPGNFSDNFRNIKNFVQVDHSEKKTASFFLFSAPGKPPVAGNFQDGQNQTHIDVRLSC